MKKTKGGVIIPDQVIEQKEMKLKGLMFSLAQDMLSRNPDMDPAACLDKAEAFMRLAREKLDEEPVTGDPRAPLFPPPGTSN